MTKARYSDPLLAFEHVVQVIKDKQMFRTLAQGTPFKVVWTGAGGRCELNSGGTLRLSGDRIRWLLEALKDVDDIQLSQFITGSPERYAMAILYGCRIHDGFPAPKWVKRGDPSPPSFREKKRPSKAKPTQLGPAGEIFAQLGLDLPKVRTEPISGHPWGKQLRAAGTELATALHGRHPDLIVRAWTGGFAWSAVPFLAYLDSRFTKSVKEGFYVAHRFAESGKRIVLGVFHGNREPPSDDSDYARERIAFIERFGEALTKFGFDLDGVPSYCQDQSKNDYFQATTVAWRGYRTDAIPSDDQLALDLAFALQAVEEFRSAPHQTRPMEAPPVSDPVPSNGTSKKMQREVVLIDGSNVANLKKVGGKPTLSHVEVVAALVDRKGFHPVVVVDASLRHKVPSNERERLEALIDEGVITQAPAGLDGDLLLLNYSNEHGSRIITNDLYRDHEPKYPWVKERRIPLALVGEQYQLFI